jgi:integration host factor subunit beta
LNKVGGTIATVTKQDIIDRIAERLDCRKNETRAIMQQFLEEIMHELELGNRLEFREFGVFEIKQRAPRKARNPQTGATVTVPAREVVHFKPGRRLKELAERELERFEPEPPRAVPQSRTHVA